MEQEVVRDRVRIRDALVGASPRLGIEDTEIPEETVAVLLGDGLDGAGRRLVAARMDDNRYHMAPYILVARQAGEARAVCYA